MILLLINLFGYFPFCFTSLTASHVCWKCHLQNTSQALTLLLCLYISRALQVTPQASCSQALCSHQCTHHEEVTNKQDGH